MLDCGCFPPMPSELVKLAQLQELEHHISELNARIAGYPEKIAEREAALTDTAEKLAETDRELTKESAARRRMESDTEDFRQKDARYQAQLDTAQSDNQVHALEHQISFCKQEISRIEDLELASLMRTEELETQKTTLNETAANQKVALEKEKIASQESLAQDKTELTALTGEHGALRSAVDVALLAEYDRIVRTRKNAVAEIEEPKCSACQMAIRPQRWNEIREGALHLCESCGRFLYYNPPVDLTDAIALPSTAKKPSKSS